MMVDRITLDPMSPGTERHLKAFRYGTRGARPKAYLQGALHADELPGALALTRLRSLLDEAERRGDIQGEIILVPLANPGGLGQVLGGVHIGRRDFRLGSNFNRRWLDLSDGLAAAVEPLLGPDPAANVAAIRAALGGKLASLEPLGELARLRCALTGMAYDADIVLDLHCDDDALMHVYMMPQHWSAGADLAAELGAVACLLHDDSGDFCFDESHSLPFTRLHKALGTRYSIPAACFAATVELRGQADVSDELAEADAAALYRFLQRRGLVAGDPGPLSAPACVATPLDGADFVEAPAPGLLTYKVALGTVVQQGEVLAELVDPLADDPTQSRRPITARCDGLVLARRLKKLVAPGDSVAMVVSAAALPHRQGRIMVD
ncbi:MAG: succinylglutamate desuccinylase/aspartoacylase family protein, partial [Aliidongia sp.]